jgi:hypothetical protein
MKMDEYISKQRAKDRMGCCLASVKAEYKAAKDEFKKARFGDYISAIQSMIDVIGKVEAADVQPVKHGYWIKQPEKFQIYEDVINSNYLYSCSCCNASDLHSERANNDGEVKFCWRCGARMDGDTE